ncbi:hypothetical protein AB3Z07_27565 (plasmid) [Metabacillus halosaccharovorans]|uniref:hypothetical protein n=1 Tax=Metabacillus halosaccharovorans TaxID=930124 RepID=UPI00203AFC3B|nr:hypothetical protein [Metabacillus halosaccharovorans]MCM3441320.1 hypothetical protein [Metabacillus halosaccharovorans]
MVINHAGVLKKEYFIAYLKLIINAFECSIEQAKAITFERLFGLNENSLGKETYLHFLNAYEEICKKRCF